MFRPITENMEERVKLIKESMSEEIALEQLKRCNTLEDYYYYSERIKNGVILQMQLYILENYKKVTLEEWNKHTFIIEPHLGKYIGYFGKGLKRVRNLLGEPEKIVSINFVLDEIDGDFSVDFNKGCWCFISGEEVFRYYCIIKSCSENV